MPKTGDTEGDENARKRVEEPGDAARNGAEDPHEKARNLAEEALGAYAEGDQRKGDKLAEEAARIDRSAVEEVVQEIDEDAGSDHSADEA